MDTIKKLPKTPKMKCIICDEIIKKNDDFAIGYNGNNAHMECRYDNDDYASTLFEFLPDGEINKTQFTDEFILFSDNDNYDFLPYPIKKQKWVKTDGWRGYTDWEFEKGFLSVGDGWVTSHPDETTENKKELGDIFQDLQEKKITPPCIVYWVFGITSNVFSTASEVLIKKEDKKVFEKWLKKINGGLVEFKEKFY